MRFSLGPWGESIAELVAAARTAEDGGFETVWFPELHRSATIPLAVTATETSTIRVGTGIALAFVRSPLITALTAIDLDELSEGRFLLGVGTGAPRLNTDWHNRSGSNPVDRLRETVTIINRVIAESHLGEKIKITGQHEQIRLAGFERPFRPVRLRIPVFVASTGPLATRLAGEIGDGWLGLELGSPDFLREEILPRLEQGLRAAGRDRNDIEVVPSACCLILADSREAKRQMANLVAFYASVRSYTPFFAWHGFETEAREIQARFRAGDVRGMASACTDEMVDVLTLAGTKDEVHSRLSDYESLADSVKLSPPTHNIDSEVTRSAQTAILETFAN